MKSPSVPPACMLAIACCAAISAPAPAADPPPTVGEVRRLDARLDALVPAGTQLEIIADGMEWCEGPVWVPALQSLLFSDIPRNKILQWNRERGLRDYLHPAGYTGDAPRGGESGSNGLLLSPAGQLVLCQHGDRRMALMEAPLDQPAPNFVTLADRYDGRRLNSPNDAVYHSRGDLYFTDPPYGLERSMQDPAKELPFQGVYLLRVSGELELLTRDLGAPNGIGLSPDEKTLYVAQSDPQHPIWMAFPLLQDGRLGEGRVLFDASHLSRHDVGLPDGMAIDRQGNLWATGPGGVLVLTADGEHLGTLATTQATSNCTLGEDGRTLFVTADRYVLRVRLQPEH